METYSSDIGCRKKSEERNEGVHNDTLTEQARDSVNRMGAGNHSVIAR
jgi:hypothetical protein